MRRKAAVAVTGVLALAALTACSSDDGGAEGDGAAGDSTVTVAYQKTTAFHQLDDMLQVAKTQFEDANPGITVELQPIEADENDYSTKLALMNGSAETAPDVFYEDTFQSSSDVDGRLPAAARRLPGGLGGLGPVLRGRRSRPGAGDDGKTYGVSMGTDTRGIYFNKTIFEQAGLPTDWQPKTLGRHPRRRPRRSRRRSRTSSR